MFLKLDPARLWFTVYEAMPKCRLMKTPSACGKK